MHTTLSSQILHYCSTVLHYCGWEAERCQDGQLHGDRHLCACCMSREQSGGLTGMSILAPIIRYLYLRPWSMLPNFFVQEFYKPVVTPFEMEVACLRYVVNTHTCSVLCCLQSAHCSCTGLEIGVEIVSLTIRNSSQVLPLCIVHVVFESTRYNACTACWHSCWYVNSCTTACTISTWLWYS